MKPQAVAGRFINPSCNTKGNGTCFITTKISPRIRQEPLDSRQYLYFNEDGSIKKVIPTLRGVGIVDAKSKIQIDRYSDISKQGVSVLPPRTRRTSSRAGKYPSTVQTPGFNSTTSISARSV